MWNNSSDIHRVCKIYSVKLIGGPMDGATPLHRGEPYDGEPLLHVTDRGIAHAYVWCTAKGVYIYCGVYR